MALPLKPQPPTRVNPKSILIYSMPKVGKTYSIQFLPNHLHLDTEQGGDMYTLARVACNNIQDLLDRIEEARQANLKAYTEQTAKGVKTSDIAYPYQFGIIDRIDRIEEMADVYMTAMYNSESYKKEKDAMKQVTTITELPYGKGHELIRSCIFNIYKKAKEAFPHVITFAHVKAKTADTKIDALISVNEINMNTKIATMICGDADMILYFRQKGDQYILSTQNANTDKATANFRSFPHIKFDNFGAIDFDVNKNPKAWSLLFNNIKY